MNARTAFQETLLGDGPGSAIAWSLYRQGYERGAQSGWEAGYADGIADMLGAADDFRETVGRVSTVPSHTELERRRNKHDRDGLDRRTGPQIIADAHASWATIDIKGAVA